MCKISFEKWICFLFLIVILVVLSCSGFPIDNLAMPDTKNKYIFLNKIRNRLNSELTPTPSPHRLRHLRQLRAQTRELRTQRLTPITGHIEATVFQKNDAISPSNSEHYLQVPSSLTKTINPFSSSIISRQQRSKKQRQDCQPEHFSTKAYKSPIVLLVKVQGIEPTNYTVSFKLIKQFKNSSQFPIHEFLTLQFSNRTGKCDRGLPKGRRHLVKADIKASGEYVLFLNVSGMPSYSPEEIPSPPSRRWKLRKFKMNMLEKVCRLSKPKPTSIVELKNLSSWTKPKSHPNRRKKLKLTCRAAGLPFPRISWRRNNVTMVNSRHVRISYVKRRSTLEIPNPVEDDFGWYECVARGVDGKNASSIEVLGPPPATTQIPFSEPVYTKRECNKDYREFCMGHGTCYTDYNNQIYCECKDGYIGQRCEEKTPPHHVKRHLKHEGKYGGKANNNNIINKIQLE